MGNKKAEKVKREVGDPAKGQSFSVIGKILEYINGISHTPGWRERLGPTTKEWNDHQQRVAEMLAWQRGPQSEPLPAAPPPMPTTSPLPPTPPPGEMQTVPLQTGPKEAPPEVSPGRADILALMEEEEKRRKRQAQLAKLNREEMEAEMRSQSPGPPSEAMDYMPRPDAPAAGPPSEAWAYMPQRGLSAEQQAAMAPGAAVSGMGIPPATAIAEMIKRLWMAGK